MADPDITFAGGQLDRAITTRTDAAALGDALASSAARFIPVWRQQCLVEGDRAALVAASELGVWMPAVDDVILLGRRDDHWLFAIELDPEIETPQGGGREFEELRSVMGHLAPRDAALVAYARAMARAGRGGGPVPRPGLPLRGPGAARAVPAGGGAPQGRLPVAASPPTDPL